MEAEVKKQEDRKVSVSRSSAGSCLVSVCQDPRLQQPKPAVPFSSGWLFLLATTRCLEYVPGDHPCLFCKHVPWKTASGHCNSWYSPLLASCDRCWFLGFCFCFNFLFKCLGYRLTSFCKWLFCLFWNRKYMHTDKPEWKLSILGRSGTKLWSSPLGAKLLIAASLDYFTIGTVFSVGQEIDWCYLTLQSPLSPEAKINHFYKELPCVEPTVF